MEGYRWQVQCIWQFLFDSDNYIQCLLYLRGKVAYIKIIVNRGKFWSLWWVWKSHSCFFFYFLKSGTSCGKGSDFQTIVSLSCRLLNSSLNSSLPNSYPPPGRPNYIIMRPSKLGGVGGVCCYFVAHNFEFMADIHSAWKDYCCSRKIIDHVW